MTKLYAILITAIVCFYAGLLAAHFLASDIERIVLALLLMAGSSWLTWICKPGAQ